MLAQIVSLLRDDAYESALAVCGFLNNGKKGTRESLVLAGRALMGLNEHHRAINHFRAALSFRPTKSGPDVGVVDATQTTIRYLTAKCLEKLHEWEAAIAELFIIEPHNRGVRVLLLLGKLHKRTGSVARATAEYKAALDKNPLALEAVHALCELGYVAPPSSAAAAAAAATAAASSSGGGGGGTAAGGGRTTAAEANAPWLGAYMAAFHGQANRDYVAVNAALDQLLADYPGNTPVSASVLRLCNDHKSPSNPMYLGRPLLYCVACMCLLSSRSRPHLVARVSFFCVIVGWDVGRERSLNNMRLSTACRRARVQRM